MCIRKLQQQLNNSCVSAAVGVQIYNVKYGRDSGGWETDPAMLEWEPVHGHEVRRWNQGKRKEKGNEDYVYEAPSLCNLIGAH